MRTNAEIKQIQQMFAEMTVCPICFEATNQRGEIVVDGEQVLVFPVCGEHLDELASLVEARGHVTFRREK